MAGAPKFAVVLALRSLRLHGLPVPHLPSDLGCEQSNIAAIVVRVSSVMDPMA